MESILSLVPSLIGISYLFGFVSAGFACRVLDLPDRQQEQKTRSDPPAVGSNNISSLSYGKLQEDYKTLLGTTQILRKRLRDNLQNQEEEPPAKRQKKYEEDFICPINLHLPLDPVTATDGHVYEREAIEQHIKNNRGGKLVSPITRQKMGQKLMAALTIKNTIEKMVDNGDIAGELAEDWKGRVKQKKDMEDALMKAQGGDLKAMEWVANNYGGGSNGF